MFTPAQRDLLQAKLDNAHVKTRQQSGRTLSYIEAWHARAECNTVFGFDGWDHEVSELRVVMERERRLGRPPNDYDGWGVSYVCKVRVIVRAGDDLSPPRVVVVREGIGAGHGADRDLGLAHESAAKEAESDALKRALTSFGWRFGLALYDKDQEHVESSPNGRLNGAAGGDPQPPAPRQQRTNVVTNPKTGRKIDTENARNQRPEWAKFADRVQGYVDARDADGLKLWFASDDVAAYVAGWVFKDEAHDHVDGALEVIERLA